MKKLILSVFLLFTASVLLAQDGLMCEKQIPLIYRKIKKPL